MSIWHPELRPWIHIIGGGLSGLSLAYALSQYDCLPGEVVITEPRTDYTNDRTFSFWFNESQRALLQPEYESDCWCLSQQAQPVHHHSQKLKYGIRSSVSVYRQALRAIEIHPQISIQHQYLNSQPDAEHVFDSRAPFISDYHLIQSFVGTEVRLSKRHAIRCVQLMENLTTINTGIEFRYVLPLGKDKLLVEHTQFTTKTADFDKLRALNIAWLEQSFGLHHQIIREEKAHIPMGIKSNQQHWGIPIGARAGMTRAATGYGYATILTWCHQAAHSLVANNRCDGYQTSTLFQKMDNLFLELIAKKPDTIPNILMQLAHGLQADTFASFMMNTRLGDALKVIYHAPKRPFVCASIGKFKWI